MPTPTQTHLDQLARDGYCIVENVLSPEHSAEVRRRLWQAAETSRQRGQSTYIESLDPNEANVRVFNLLDLDEVFRELIIHPLALSLVRHLLGEGFLISNFTANIARPGSKSMAIHSDQGVVVPEPWLEPWSMNIMWCLNESRAENGATLYLPGSHNIKSLSDLPLGAREQMKPLCASQGSIIAMDGRVWHTSGENRTAEEDRALLFGYYSKDFVRPQTNWNATLSEETKSNLGPELVDLLGLGPAANFKTGTELMSKTREMGL